MFIDFFFLDFVENCLLKNAKNICSIKTDSHKNCTKVYLLDNVYICTVNPKLNLAQAGQLTGTVNIILNFKHQYLFY